MKKAYRRPLSLRIPLAGLLLLCAVVALIAVMLALAPFNDPVISDLLPGLTLAGLLFGILIYLSVRVAV